MQEWAGGKPPTPVLDTVNFPIHLKNLSITQMKQASGRGPGGWVEAKGKGLINKKNVLDHRFRA